jgi:hypothetical protein
MCHRPHPGASAFAACASAALLWSSAAAGSCVSLGNCLGHGTCDTATSSCVCFDGWGSPTDVTEYRAPDCSQRVCPSDRAWVDVPTGAVTAHAPAECSGMGLCDRASGRCRCFAGFEGEACQRCELMGRRGEMW